MDPVAALERVAYCLDRVLTDSFRVKAYTSAAATLRELPPGELERRHADGTITELAGIGPKTGAIIAQALDGGPIPYLEELEAKTTIAAASPDAAALRAALRGDCHLHSTWSDGGASIRDMALAARAIVSIGAPPSLHVEWVWQSPVNAARRAAPSALAASMRVFASSSSR